MSGLDPPSADRIRVAIIGGGLAGLSTAVYLLKDSSGRFDVTLFEAAPHLGGQAASWQREGRTEEVGIHLDFPWYVNKQRLYEDVGQPVTLVQTDGNYYICNGQTGGIDTLYAGVQPGAKGILADLSAVGKALYGLWNFPGLQRGEFGWLLRLIVRLLRMTTREMETYDIPVDDFLRRMGATENMIRQLSLETVTIQGMFIHDASATSFLKFLKATYGCTTPQNPAFFNQPTGEALIEPLVQFIAAQGGQLVTGQPIQQVTIDDQQQLQVNTGDKTLPCDHVVFAMPGYLVPPLIPERYRSADLFQRLTNLTSANVVTLTLWYVERWFPDHNVYISNRDGVLFDAVADKARHWQSPDHGGSIVQVLIDAADDVASWSDQQIYAASLADLARFFPPEKHPRSAQAWNVLRHRNIYCETKPGYWGLVPRSHTTPIANLYLAGDYTAGLYHYGMESAVISGKETANLIRAKLAWQSNLCYEFRFCRL